MCVLVSCATYVAVELLRHDRSHIDVGRIGVGIGGGAGSRTAGSLGRRACESRDDVEAVHRRRMPIEAGANGVVVEDKTDRPERLEEGDSKEETVCFSIVRSYRVEVPSVVVCSSGAQLSSAQQTDRQTDS